jgi:hypothetical protein
MMEAAAKNWEAEEHDGVARRSYGGAGDNILGLKRSVSEIHRRTVNGASAGGGTRLEDDDRADQG